MTVNANSVITTQLNSYYPAVYTALTDMENYCYTSSQQTTFSGGTAGLTEYQPFFQDLNTALVAWFGYNFQDSLNQLIDALYAYIVIGNNYGQSTTLTASTDCYSMLGCAGYFVMLLTQPVSYYDDYQAPAVQTGTGTCANLTTDTATVNGAPSSDTSTMDSRASSLRGSSAGLTNKLLFEPVALSGTPYTQTQMGDEIFNTLNYKMAYKYLNVGSLTLPSYIT